MCDAQLVRGHGDAEKLRSSLADRLQAAWVARWLGIHPRWGGTHADVLYDHRHAHPEFRNPLSAHDSIRASAEFHHEVSARLVSSSGSVILLFFDYEYAWEGNAHRDTSQLHDDFEAEHFVALSEIDESGSPLTVHVFAVELSSSDPRWQDLWELTAAGNEHVLLTDHDVRVLVRPLEECVAVYSHERSDLTQLAEVEADVWRRWGIKAERGSLIDLAQVNAYVDRRRTAWADDGVSVSKGPQYRTWDDDDAIVVVDELPVDLGRTDWLLIELSTATELASATVIVHDQGAADVLFETDADEDKDMERRHREKAGSLCGADVPLLLEDVVQRLRRA